MGNSPSNTIREPGYVIDPEFSGADEAGNRYILKRLQGDSASKVLKNSIQVSYIPKDDTAVTYDFEKASQELEFSRGSWVEIVGFVDPREDKYLWLMQSPSIGLVLGANSMPESQAVKLTALTEDEIRQAA